MLTASWRQLPWKKCSHSEPVLPICILMSYERKAESIGDILCLRGRLQGLASKEDTRSVSAVDGRELLLEHRECAC